MTVRPAAVAASRSAAVIDRPSTRAALRLYQALRMSPNGGKRRRASSVVMASTSAGQRSRASPMFVAKSSSSHSRNPTRSSPVTE